MFSYECPWTNEQSGHKGLWKEEHWCSEGHRQLWRAIQRMAWTREREFPSGSAATWTNKDFWCRCARGKHPYPSRTRWLSPGRPMILRWGRRGKAGGCQILLKITGRWADEYIKNDHWAVIGYKKRSSYMSWLLSSQKECTLKTAYCIYRKSNLYNN